MAYNSSYRAETWNYVKYIQDWNICSFEFLADFMLLMFSLSILVISLRINFPFEMTINNIVRRSEKLLLVSC